MPELDGGSHSASRTDRIWEAAVVLASTAYVVVLAWPASIAPGAWVWGSHGDGLGNIVEFTWYVQAARQGLPPAVDPNLSIPFGENFGAQPHEPIYYLTQMAIGLLTNSVVAINVMDLVAPVIASWFMFRLILRITRTPAAAFVGGIGFGCCSYILSNTHGEPTLAQIWIFPATILAVLWLFDRPSGPRTIVTAVIVMVAMLVNFYYVVFVALALTALGLCWLLYRFLEKRVFPYRPMAAGLIAGLLAALGTVAIYEIDVGHLAQRAAMIHRSSTTLSVLAASPIDFLLPPRENPWLGQLRQQAFEARLQRNPGVYTDFSELSTSLPILILGVAGLLIVIVARWRGLDGGRVRRVEVVGVIGVGLLGVWLLIPPFGRHYGLNFLSLEYDIWSVAPQYASFYRAGMLVVFAICALAAVAVAALAARRPRAAAVVAVVAVLLTFGENYTTSTDRVLAVAPFGAEAWVAQHPGKYAVAVYPLLPTASGANEFTAEFYQRFHGHPLVNGHSSGNEAESMRAELRDPNREGVPEALAALGVRYVIWRPDIIDQYAPLNPAYADQMRMYEPQASAYQAMASYQDGSRVFEVVTNPASAFGFYASGFGPPTPEDAADWVRHTDSDRASIDTYVPGSAVALQLHFTCATRDPGITLSIGGDVWSIGPGAGADIRIPVTARAGITRTSIGISPAAAADHGDVWCSPIVAAS